MTSFAVQQPDGWLERPRPALKVPLPARAFHPPDDATQLYFVARGDGHNLQLATLADGLVEGTVVTKTLHDDGGRTIDERISDLPNGQREHVRVVYGHAGDKIDVVVGVCIAKGANLQACEARLADLSVDADASSHAMMYGIAGGALAIALLMFVLWRRQRGK